MTSTGPTNPSRLIYQRYLQLTIRHKWWIILAFIAGTSLSILYSYSLPLLYRSSTVILVEPQKIPIAYVSPTVTSTVQERLSTISQQILSRTNLEKIILQFGLYKEEEKGIGRLLTILNGQIKSWANVDLETFFTSPTLKRPGADVPLEALVERMRRNIEVKVTGGGNAFTVSYTGKDPLTVMRVTNTLASLFIEENLKLREQQAEGTSEFLEQQLAEAKRQLERQEQALKEFKEKQMGALPGQMDVNLRTLDRLQLELQNTDEALRTAEERKISLVRFQQELRNIDEALKSLDSVSESTLQGGGLGRSSPHLSQLKEELSRLQLVFNDNYPDIISLKRQIQEYEQGLNTAETPKESEGNVLPPTAQHESSGNQQAYLYSAELLSLNSEIESLKRRRERTTEQIKLYEKRVDDTFPNEQTLANLTRDYETSQRYYQGLLDKRLHAKIAENLEKRQKGEQFRIIDPANLPQQPYQPDRRKIMLLGSLFSLALGVGAILLKDHLTPSFRTPEDVYGAVALPVLASIPYIQLMRKKEGSPVTVQEPDSFIAEQYRVLYTKLSQSAKGKLQTAFAISSAMQEEGKTITALNLAVVAARDFGKKTLLVEGDFKNPAISTYLQLHPQCDFVDILSSHADPQSGMLPYGHDNLSIVPVLKSIKNSSGILNSKEMQDFLTICRERYDFILIDSPPILSLPDMNILEKLVDGILLVVRAEKTPQDAVVKAIDSVVTDKLVGIVLNGVQQPRSRYYRYAYGSA